MKKILILIMLAGLSFANSYAKTTKTINPDEWEAMSPGTLGINYIFENDELKMTGLSGGYDIVYSAKDLPMYEGSRLSVNLRGNFAVGGSVDFPQELLISANGDNGGTIGVKSICKLTILPDLVDGKFQLKYSAVDPYVETITFDAPQNGELQVDFYIQEGRLWSQLFVDGVSIYDKRIRSLMGATGLFYDLSFASSLLNGSSFNATEMGYTIPEPSTYACVLGLLVLGFVAFRKRK